MIIPFYKYQGTGNDFVIIHDEDANISLTEEKIVQITDRKFGVGSDGIILIRPHKDFDFEMIFYNPDASQSFCGNGSRCAVLFAFHMGIAGKQVHFLSTDGPHKAKISKDSNVELQMTDSIVVDVLGENSFFVDTGSPHFVSFNESIDGLDLISSALKIRNLPKYKDGGVNVNFVETRSQDIKIRTYERGVENETLSCGTGVTACALVHAINKNLQSEEIAVETKGGSLSVCFTKQNNTFTNVWLKGPAAYVFKGEIDG